MARQQPKNRGIVYILSNKAMPDYLKIGMVRDDQLSGVRKRIRGLQSGSPYPYRIEYAAYADNVSTAEKDVHDIHAGSRMREGGGTEWFRLGLKAAEKTLDSLKGLRQLTSQELAELRGEPTATPKREAKEKAPRRASSTKLKRRSNFTFDSIGVPPRATLTYVSDRRYTARVVSQDPPLIEFRGERMTLSAAAKLLMPDREYPIDGPRYWEYNGRTIRAIRNGK